MFGSTSPRHFSLRRTALVGILVGALGALTFTGATAANAVNGDSVGTWADIQGQLNHGYSPLHLSQDIDYDSNGNSVLRTTADAVIDLNGHTLNIRGLIMAGGSTLTFEDLSSGDAGRVNTNAVGNGIPGIDVSSGSTLDIENGVTVRATGDANSAGIGSGINVADPVDPSGQTLLSGVGTISVNDGHVEAIAGSNAAGIGGGNGLPGGELDVRTGSTVDATADAGQTVIGAGHGAWNSGTLDNQGTISVDAGQTLDIASGLTAYVEGTGVISGDGSLTVEGRLQNTGTVSLPSVTNNGGQILGNNFLVTFDSNSGVEAGAQPTEGPGVRVYARSLADGDRSLPTTGFTAPGDYVSGWSTTTDGSNSFDADSSISADEVVYAKWSALSSLTVSPAKTSAPDGTAIALTVTGNGPGDLTNDQTAFADISSSNLGDDVTSTPGSIILHGYGTRSVTAHVTSQADGSNVNSNEISLISTGTLAKAMAITPTKLTVHAGKPATFEVIGEDSAGVNLGSLIKQVTWTGWSASKHDSIDSATNEPVFGTAGKRTIKATIGTHSVTATVTVIGGDPATLKFIKPVTKATAGIPAAFTVYAYDFAGNALGNVTQDTTFTPQDALPGEGGSGNLVTFVSAGQRTAVATDGTATATTPITVVHAAGAIWSGNPAYPYVDQAGASNAGDSETFPFALTDAYGNPFTTSEIASSVKVTFQSYNGSVPDYTPITTADVAKGLTVKWVQAGSRYAVFTDGQAVAYVLKSVNATAAVAKKLTFDYPSTTHYIGQPFSLSAYPSDAFGNRAFDGTNLADAVSATFSAGDKGATVSVTDTTATVTLTKTGKHTITAKSPSYTTLSQTFTGVNDTTTPVFATPVISADDPGTDVDVVVPAGGSGVTPTGTVTLKYGTKSMKMALSSGSADFTVPQFKVAGKYTFSASYSGDSLYKASSSAKVSVTVTPGALASLKFSKAPTTVVAGTTITYNVNGYDTNGNLIGSENDYATFTLSGYDNTKESVNGNQIRPTIVGTRTVTATLGGFSTASTVKVTIAPLYALQMGGATYDPTTGIYTATAGVPVTFTATALDQFGNSYGDVSKSLTFSSESSSTDKFSKNVGTFTIAENHGVTAKYKKLSFTFVVEVAAGPAVPGKYVFVDPTSTAYIGTEVYLGISTADAYGNQLEPVDSDDVSMLISPTGGTFNSDDNTVTFPSLGTYTISASVQGATVTEKVKVVKGSTLIDFSYGTIISTVGQQLTVLVHTPTQDVIPTGTVVLHFGTQTFAAQQLTNGTGNTAAATFTFTGPKAGNYKVYATYSGDAAWNKTTSPTTTISVGEAF